jgi:hypothetical protein
MRCTVILLLGLALLDGCTTAARRPAPPDLIGNAAPEGFPPTIRLVTTDLRRFSAFSPGFFRGIHDAATDGSIDILALSGGGSGGAFGAGALAGLSRAHRRPQFELVTGVSTGALIAPFAFLGPGWDTELQQAFSGEQSRRLLDSPGLSFLGRLLFPLGLGGHGPLFDMVDRYVTTAMIDAVARETARGRRLIVATTDLDKQETVLWDMGIIASRGGKAARELFRDVLIASASVPGVFPPVLIHVRDGRADYDELHVDGSVTVPVFTTPMIAGILQMNLSPLRGANLYMIVNGQLAIAPKTTPVNTVTLLSSSFSASMTYKTREAVLNTIDFTRQMDMQFHLTEIPADYPIDSFVNFQPQYMRALFDYASGCAAQGRLWLTPAQSIRRNMSPHRAAESNHPECPAATPDGAAATDSAAGGETPPAETPETAKP